MTLSLAAAFTHLEQALRDPLSAVTADGVCWRHDIATADASAVFGTSILSSTVALACAPGSPALGDPALLAKARAMARWLRTQQNAAGRIDLISCNYDSGPDSAFSWQQLIPAWIWAVKVDPELASLLEAILRPGLIGLIDGGFHTPNHRWVIASALAQGCAAFPDLAPRLRPVLDALIAEGPDIDSEGAFIERSVAVYDAVCCRALLFIDQHIGWPAGRDAALACLRLDRDLLHADGTVETGLSHRQDHGTRVVPGGLVAPFLTVERDLAPDLRGTAAWIHSRQVPGVPTVLAHDFWNVHELLGGSAPAVAVAPGDLDRLLPLNGCWRFRRGDCSISAFTGSTRLLGLAWGGAEIAAVQLGQSYLGHGRFVADRIERSGAGVVLTSPGVLAPHRLGYSHALGEPVAKDAWAEAWARRGLRALPPCATRVTITPLADGLDLHVETLSGLPGVTAQIAFDFRIGGEWITPDLALRPLAGQELWLRRGHGEIRYGRWAIAIDGGDDAHRMYEMRDFPPVGAKLARVVIALRTPIDRHVRLTLSGA